MVISVAAATVAITATTAITTITAVVVAASNHKNVKKSGQVKILPVFLGISVKML